ncbi:hypothetical protein ABB37_00237 [Leptomonas pyrrhocoris]|uniref:Uncharacterized protein n=1 Tax=Leptomonas pyrrhocoris TaxID=157538 RepID=A0A0N0E025_LEPPY|nr:hypothetical protein ABB37_00237 [Leptomonas pyrrhocoris]XP_015664375.1 hypothetical protein ABB37_00237 [Leptomonas pyrrhocoris]KPA85935.1 hypothetical protein ABB37_00237 [Leptomonas pyrrhocoris]KPA85936.1 hypothetical protein ABB37_00237 [Leptomonas pyrrhocoris]|eukprot:XP_015664374.1 hypothetical protein ABB37_00237 [Leptomonas pyrrhocoris]
MPAKKARAAAATSSNSGPTAPVRLRKRSSLNGTANGSEATPTPSNATATAASTVTAASAPVKKTTAKTRISVTSTSIVAQQAALATATAVPGSSAGTAAANALRARASASGHPDLRAPARSITETSTRAVVNGTSDIHSSGGGVAHHTVGATAGPSPNHKAVSTTPRSAVSAASKTRNHPVAATQTTAAASSDPPVAATSPTPRSGTSHVAAGVGGISDSGSAPFSAAPVARRQRGSIGAAAAAPGSSGAPTTAAASSFSNASPAPLIRTTKASASATSTLPHVSQRPDSAARPGPPTPRPPDPAAPSTGTAQPSHSGEAGSGGSTTAAVGARPRRTSATSDSGSATHTVNTAPVPASVSAAVSEAPFAPPVSSLTAADTRAAAAAAAVAEPKREEQHDHSSGAAPRMARKRTSAGTALNAKPKTPSATHFTATTGSVTSGTQAAATAAAAHSSVEEAAKENVTHRSSEAETAAPSARPSGTLPSHRSSGRVSVSIPTTAANTAPPTRDPSVAQPQHGSTTAATAATAPSNALESESPTFPALSIAKGSGSELERSTLGIAATTRHNAVAPLSNLPRHSHGPVVSEAWTRSIIKPGDEQLLYAPANAAFARTSSGMTKSWPRGAASVVRNDSKDRSSLQDPQLRRAQLTVLQQRHIATPSPDRRSTRGSATDRGSSSQFGSTVKRSGTRLQQLRHEAEERRRSLNATLSTPSNVDGSAVRAHGPMVNVGAGGGPNSASPTPSRMSDASVNTGIGGGGGGSRLSAGTPMSRRSTGSNEIPMERIPGAASVVGGPFRQTPPGVSGPHVQQQQQQQQLQQRNSPALSLFARPSPRVFATPSPRGSTNASGVPGMMVTFGVSNAPYYTGNEELTKLTRVREDMLRALLLSTTTSGAPAAAKIKDEGSTTTSLSNSGSSLPTLHADPRVGEAIRTGGGSPSAAKRPRQRIYGVGIRSDANGEAMVSPQKGPVADVPKPRGRMSSSSAEAILVSSMRQKPSAAQAAAAAGAGGPQLSPSRSPAAGGEGSGSGTTGSVARPKLSATALGATDSSFSTTKSATRLPRRSAVMVALASLQPANTLGERTRTELVQQAEESHKTMATHPGSGTETTAAAAVVSGPLKSAPISFEEATRRLLIDPFFPLVSEENYQRLVLQNDEYNERKALIMRICAVSPPKSSPLPPVGGEEEGGQPRHSATVGPKAARALEMDLAEADEAMIALSAVPADATAAAATVSAMPASLSLSTTSPGGNTNHSNAVGAAPRRPSVQYGGPTAHPSPSQTRTRSPSPGVPPTSPPLAASLNSPSSAPAPARESKLLVNAVMPSEKTGPIKPLALNTAWYTPSVAPADAAQSGAVQALLSPTILSNGPGSPASNSPRRAFSRSPSASRSSSHHATRRGSLFHGAQQSTSAAAVPASESVSSDSESTASDEVVDAAETVLRRMLPRWGPFQTPAATPPPPPAAPANATPSSTRQRRNSSSTTSTSASSVHSTGRKGKKTGESKGGAATAKESVAPTTTTMTTSVLPPAVLKELEAYVHFFLKRFRNADAATMEELGDAPETPLALQRAIRQSLRLSCGSAADDGAAEDVEGLATELQDPLDDGSFHRQNVQYVLDLLGSLLQMQDSFCEDVSSGGRATARGTQDTKQRKAKLTETDFLAKVMSHPALDRSGQDDDADNAQKSGMGNNVTRSERKPRVRPVLKLHYPELHAVELMFANLADDAATTAEGKN